MLLLPLVLILAPPESLRAQAEAHETAGRHLEAATLYLQLARQPHVARLTELSHAHDALLAAFLASERREPWHLCRATWLAEQVIDEDKFSSREQAQFWRETVGGDLAELRREATTQRRPNCRFDAQGEPFAPPIVRPAPAEARVDPPPLPRVEHPRRGAAAKVAAGATLAGLGVGAFVVAGISLRLQVHEVAALRAMAARGPLTAEDLAHADQLRLDGLTYRNMSIAAATTGALSLAAGAALIVLGRRRTVAVQPFAGLPGLLLNGQF